MPVIPFNCATGEAMPVTLAVAPTVALAPPDDSVDSNSVIISGTGVISSFGAGVVGVPITKQVKFVPTGGSITIKESASLDVLGTADHVIANPAYAEYRWDGVSKWTELSYSDASVPGGGYLPLTGGTLTGNLTIAPISGWQTLAMVKPASGQGTQIAGYTGSVSNPRWGLQLGDASAESGSNAGSNFLVTRFDDTGTYLDTPLTITRSNGVTTLTNLVDSGNCTVSGAINCATYWNNPTFTGSVVVNGNAQVGGSMNCATYVNNPTFTGNVIINGNTDFYGTRTFVRGNGLLAFINANQGGAIGSYCGTGSGASCVGFVNSQNVIYFGNMNGDGTWAGGNRMWIDGSSNMTLQGQFTCNSHVYTPTAGYRVWLYGQSGMYSDGSYFEIGDAADPATNTWKYYYNKSTGQRNWVNYQGTNCFQISPSGACVCPGGFATGSDANMKRDIEPATLPELGMAALRKITPSYFHRIQDEPPEGQPDMREPDRREFGFIAQNVQEALPDAVYLNTYASPYMSEGETDPEKMKTKEVSHLAIEIMPMLAALTNAVKELDKRLAALEAASMARST